MWNLNNFSDHGWKFVVGSYNNPALDVTSYVAVLKNLTCAH